MKENLIGKILTTKDNENYIVICMLSYKSIPCLYMQNIDDADDKRFFQYVSDEGLRIVPIESKRIITSLQDCINKESKKGPRKIKEKESITEYFKYLDEYYKTKVVLS